MTACLPQLSKQKKLIITKSPYQSRLSSSGKLCQTPERKTSAATRLFKRKRHHVTHTPAHKPRKTFWRNLTSALRQTTSDLLQHLAAVDNKKNPKNPKWVVFTARERALRPRLSPTLVPPRRGSRPPPTRSLTRSASSPKRVLLPLRSVLFCGTATVLLRSSLSLVCFAMREEGKRKSGKKDETNVDSE